MQWEGGRLRPTPWKGEKNPYLVWLSEVILQQTRVAQGMPYFERFAARFPTVQELAAAPEDEVMKLWEGLGYYSRARSLHAAAKYISGPLQGVFPDSYNTLLALPGVGPYTAAAIASFAFGLPYAVVDGNVLRVLARFFGVDLPVDETAGKQALTILADAALDRLRPAEYNQAIMDFGATVCTPALPKCPSCPLRGQCSALLEGRVAELPVKAKRTEKTARYFTYLVVNDGDFVWIRKRTERDIWQGLYEFPLVETNELPEGDAPLERSVLTGAFRLLQISKPYRQTLTHRYVIAFFRKIEAGEGFSWSVEGLMKVEKNKLTNFAFPKIIDAYLQEKALSLF